VSHLVGEIAAADRSERTSAASNDEDERTAARIERLVRFGWDQRDAEVLAARLARRDADEDDRRVCAVDCLHYRPGRCGNWRRALIGGPEVGRDFAGPLPRRPGFKASQR
jgi:hypothetical protein